MMLRALLLLLLPAPHRKGADLNAPLQTQISHVLVQPLIYLVLALPLMVLVQPLLVVALPSLPHPQLVLSLLQPPLPHPLLVLLQPLLPSPQLVLSQPHPQLVLSHLALHHDVSHVPSSWSEGVRGQLRANCPNLLMTTVEIPPTEVGRADPASEQATSDTVWLCCCWQRCRPNHARCLLCRLCSLPELSILSLRGGGRCLESLETETEQEVEAEVGALCCHP